MHPPDRRVGVVHLSTGEVFRQAVRAQTRLGGQVQACLAHGFLVPDELVAEVVAARLTDPEVDQRGFVLDGFPRRREIATGSAGARLRVARMVASWQRVASKWTIGLVAGPASGLYF